MRARSPRAAALAVRREVALRREEERLERSLAAGGPVVVGPFVGEVGYELLYWRPFVLRLLRDRSIEPTRVTVLGRGGSGAWYRSVAASSDDVFELVTPEAIRAAAAARPFASPKQLDSDELDRQLLAAAGIAGATVIHPRFMYWRLRPLWEGLRDPGDARALGDYDRLPRSELPGSVEARLPADYVAVKAYFNECVPDEPVGRAALLAVVTALAASVPVVVLSTPVAVDAHRDLGAIEGVVTIVDALDPAANLAQQAEIVARARALVSTYGGFSYLGPFLDVPTVALAMRHEDNPNHERVLRASRPGARFTRLAPDADAVLGSLPR